MFFYAGFWYSDAEIALGGFDARTYYTEIQMALCVFNARLLYSDAEMALCFRYEVAVGTSVGGGQLRPLEEVPSGQRYHMVKGLNLMGLYKVHTDLCVCVCMCVCVCVLAFIS